MNPEDLYFATLDDFAAEAGVAKNEVSSLNFGVSKQLIGQDDIREPEKFLGDAEKKDLNLCLKPEAGLLGIYYQKLEDLWKDASDKELLGEKMQDANTFISFSHENPVESLITFDYWKFYDSSLGTFSQEAEDEAKFPFAPKKCEGVAWGIYDKSEFDYNKIKDAYDRPIWQFAMDSAEEYHGKAANIYIGYEEHPWGLRDKKHRKEFTNIETEGDGTKKEDQNEDAGEWKGDVDYNANLFDPEWSYYDHAQWARVYSKIIGSKYKETKPKDDFFKQTKLLTINDLLLLNVRKSQTQFSIDDVFGQDDKDAIISITDTEIIINDIEAKDPSKPHEIDFYTPCTCFSRTPPDKFLNYANAIGGECKACWHFMNDEQQRLNDGYDIYTIKVHDVSKAGSWESANSSYYRKSKCGSPAVCLHNQLRWNPDTNKTENDPALIETENCWNQTATHLDCGSNYAINGSYKIWVIKDTHDDGYLYDTTDPANQFIQNAMNRDGPHEVSWVWTPTSSSQDAVYEKIKSAPHTFMNSWIDSSDEQQGDGYAVFKGCGYCFMEWASTWTNSSRPPKERLRAWFAQHNPDVTPEEHINLNVGDMCCGYTEIFDHCVWDGDSSEKALYEKFVERPQGSNNYVRLTATADIKELHVGPNICYEIIDKETINPAYNKYKAARLLQYTG